MAMHLMKRTVAVMVIGASAIAGLTGAAEPAGKTEMSGEVKPGSGWLKRQGLAPSFPIRFTIDAQGRARGTMQFAGNIYPAVGGATALTGRRDADGSASYLFAAIKGRPGSAVQAEIKITLTGFDEEDGSLQGVGVIDMADLACVTDPERSRTRCARRMVPVKWTARK